MKILFKNFRIFNGFEFIKEKSLLVENGKVTEIADNISGDFDEVYDGKGEKILSPGLIDIHAHFREPGGEWHEDLNSGAHAGAAGGFTTMVAMPNTKPAISEAALVEYIINHSESVHSSRILPAGCVSKDRAGVEMAELYKMSEAGAVFFTDDGAPIATSNLLRLSLLYTGKTLPRIMEHPEDKSLFVGGQVHEGKVSALSGLKGIPAASEEIDIARGIALTRETEGRMHFTHISSKGSVKLVREAKAEGIDVTCDTTFHHLTLNENAVINSGYSSVLKVNPPLRTPDDQDSMWKGMVDGTIDAIITDHAPYHMDDKDVPFEEAPFGIASLECAVAAVLDYRAKHYPEVPIETVLNKMTAGPAALLPEKWQGLGKLSVGAIADITIIDEMRTRVVNCEEWNSKARCTPWNGQALTSWPVMTFVAGKKVWEDNGEI